MENKTTKYFKYAIGEIILVVIGILIALSINNWNEERTLRLEERAILEELNNNLEVNIIILTDYVNLHKQRKSELKSIIIHLENKRPFSDTLGSYLRNVRIGEYLSLVTSAFESLKSVGFNLIESSTLRTSIINLFNYDYDQKLKTISSIVEMQYQATHEVFVKRLSFKDSIIEKVIPNDYQLLLEDKVFHNLLTYRMAGKNGAINMGSELLESTINLQTLLNEELNTND